MFRLFLLSGLFFCIFEAQSKEYQSKIFIAISPASCNGCNRITSSFVDIKSDKIEFVFSPNDFDSIQLEAFLIATLKFIPKFRLDEDLFAAITNDIILFKSPQVAIVNQKEDIIRSFPLDSMYYYKDLIHSILNDTYSKNIINDKKLKRIPGITLSTLVGDFLFITCYSIQTVIHYVNLKSNFVDTICLSNNDSLLSMLLSKKGIKNVDISKIKSVYLKYDLPYDIASFDVAISKSGNEISGFFFVEYIDPNSVFDLDTIFPKTFVYLFTFNPYTKLFRLEDFNYFFSDKGKEQLSNDLQLDMHLASKLNDSTWIMGTAPIYGDFKNQKTFAFFSDNPLHNSVCLNSKLLTIQTDSLVTFRGEIMNQINRTYTYKLLDDYLFFKESPYFYQYSQNQGKKLYNIQLWSKDIDWIYDMYQTPNTLWILVSELEDTYVYVMSRSNNKVVSKLKLNDADIFTNASIDELGNVVYLNKKGQVITFSLN
jgi:hypothetical protein